MSLLLDLDGDYENLIHILGSRILLRKHFQNRLRTRLNDNGIKVINVSKSANGILLRVTGLNLQKDQTDIISREILHVIYK